MYIPGNPVLTEILCEMGTGVIIAICPNPSGEPRMGTLPHIKSESVFQDFDHGQCHKDIRETGIEAAGAQGQYLIKNGRLEVNPHATKTLFVDPSDPLNYLLNGGK